MSKDPKVIDPPDYDMADWARKCGEHAGVFGCPVCNEYYNDYGGMRIVECIKCNFQFPTDWWPVYSRGVQDGCNILKSGAELSGGMKIRMDNPYYRAGFNSPSGEAWNTRGNHDWRVLTTNWTPEMCKAFGLTGKVCERCGQLKDESRRNRSGECVKCEADTECRHRCSMMEKCCKAGVVLAELTSKLSPGHSMPCYYIAGTTPIHCDKYERRTVEEVQAEDAEIEAHMAKFILVGPLVRRIKQEHKGESWSGVEACPVCKGKLHLSHAGYNSHVHGQCETDGCVSWME